MIIRTSGPALVFIRQPDHARLARRVMQHCLPLLANPRAASILYAVGEHDNGWAEADAAPMVDPQTGQPLDFVNAPAAARQDVWPRGIARLAPDPWAAALVATHALTIYDRYRADTAWTAFFEQMETRQSDMLRASGGRLADLLADYAFVRLGDLISLVFCTAWTDEQGFAEWRVSGSGPTVMVTPDPFGGRTIPLEIAARQLPAQPFRSDEVLRDMLSRARRIVLRGELRASTS